MGTSRVRTVIGIAAVGASVALVLSGCTSEPSSDLPSQSESVIESTPSSDSTSTGATEPSNAASEACKAYFELDLLNSTYVGGAVKDGDMTETQARADFTKLLRIMVRQGKLAVADGALDQRFVNNTKRMRKAVTSLPKSAALSAMPKKKQTRFVTESARVQRVCTRAGYPLPDDNVTARRAAGLVAAT